LFRYSAEFELGKSKGKIIEQIIRPTGLVDPEIIIRKSDGQIEDLMKKYKYGWLNAANAFFNNYSDKKK